MVDDAGSMARPSVHPGTLVDVAVQLHRDEAAELAALAERDRAVGLQLGAEADTAADPAARARWLVRWLDALPGASRSGGAALTTVGLGAVLLGLLLGYGVARAVLYYDGSHPVNVVHVLVVFVVLQALTLVLFVVAAWPGRRGARGQAGGGLPEALRRLGPGRWVAGLTRLLPADFFASEVRDALERMTGRGDAHGVLYGRVQKWQLLAWSQAFALAFNIGAIAGAVQLIVGSDLAFGWSTTLDVDERAMKRLTDTLSLPWAWAWEGAVPDDGTIAATRTFRAETFGGDAGAAGVFTKWWPFVLMCMVTYGLLPRVVTWAVSRARLRAAAGRALGLLPGGDAVLRRMTRPRVATRAAGHEAGNAGASTGPAEPVEIAPPTDRVACVVRWAAAPLPAGADDTSVLDAGGGATLADDRAALRQAQARSVAAGPGAAVVVRVKAWEPPLGELIDFLRELRGGVAEGAPIEVSPAGDGDRVVWRDRLTRVGDPWLRLVGEAE